MSSTDEIFESLGDRLKTLEKAEAGRFADRRYPLMCRLDGRSFHTFTRGLPRPYDQRLSDLMVDTTKYLVDKLGARLGYTQSDEISLYWDLNQADYLSEYIFKGKFQKIVSVSAGLATGYFNKELAKRIPEKADTLPVFDSRVWQVYTDKDVFLNFLWRQEDAVKNSISMLAQTYFSAKELHGVNSEQKKNLMIAKGRPWDDEPEFFKSGSFVTRVQRPVALDEKVLRQIPEEHRPTGPVMRSVVDVVSPGILKTITIEEWKSLVETRTTLSGTPAW